MRVRKCKEETQWRKGELGGPSDRENPGLTGDSKISESRPALCIRSCSDENVLCRYYSPHQLLVIIEQLKHGCYSQPQELNFKLCLNQNSNLNSYNIASGPCIG